MPTALCSSATVRPGSRSRKTFAALLAATAAGPLSLVAMTALPANAACGVNTLKYAATQTVYSDVFYKIAGSCHDINARYTLTAADHILGEYQDAAGWHVANAGWVAVPYGAGSIDRVLVATVTAGTACRTAAQTVSQKVDLDI